MANIKDIVDNYGYTGSRDAQSLLVSAREGGVAYDNYNELIPNKSPFYNIFSRACNAKWYLNTNGNEFILRLEKPYSLSNFDDPYSETLKPYLELDTKVYMQTKPILRGNFQFPQNISSYGGFDKLVLKDDTMGYIFGETNINTYGGNASIYLDISNYSGSGTRKVSAYLKNRDGDIVPIKFNYKNAINDYSVNVEFISSTNPQPSTRTATIRAEIISQDNDYSSFDIHVILNESYVQNIVFEGILITIDKNGNQMAGLDEPFVVEVVAGQYINTTTLSDVYFTNEDNAYSLRCKFDSTKVDGYTIETEDYIL